MVLPPVQKPVHRPPVIQMPPVAQKPPVIHVPVVQKPVTKPGPIVAQKPGQQPTQLPFPGQFALPPGAGKGQDLSLLGITAR